MPFNSRVDVCDRGADVFEYLDHKHQRGEFYVVRACQDRCIEVEKEGKTRGRNYLPMPTPCPRSVNGKCRFQPGTANRRARPRCM